MKSWDDGSLEKQVRRAKPWSVRSSSFIPAIRRVSERAVPGSSLYKSI